MQSQQIDYCNLLCNLVWGSAAVLESHCNIWKRTCVSFSILNIIELFPESTEHMSTKSVPALIPTWGYCVLNVSDNPAWSLPGTDCPMALISAWYWK